MKRSGLSGRAVCLLGLVCVLGARVASAQTSGTGAAGTDGSMLSLAPSAAPSASTLNGHVLWSVHLPDQLALPLYAGIRDWDVVNAIAVSPRVIYVAGAVASGSTLIGRRARSTDGGRTWTVISGLYARPEPTQIVLDPLDEDVAYFVNQQPGDGCLAKTTDGGATVVALTLPRGSCPSRVLIDPATGTLYANGAKSTDGGASWTLLVGGYTDFLALDASIPPRIYARSPTLAGGFVRGTGEQIDWQPISDTAHFVAVDPLNPQTLYAASSDAQLLKSTDDGASWSVVLTSPQAGGYRFGTGAVHPTSSNDIVVYGTTTDGWGLWHSNDGGATWAALGIYPAVFAWDPQDTSTILVGTQASNAIHVSALTADVTLPATFGSTITWTATAAGGVAPLDYQFWRLDTDGWHIVQDYGPSATYSWTTTSADIGEHALQVWVRSAGSHAAYEDYFAYGVFEVTGATITFLASSVTFPAHAGYPITWTSSATGGAAPLFYKFWLYCSSSGTWTVAQDWNVANGFTMTPTHADTCAVQVWVRSSGSSATYEDWSSSGYFTIWDVAPVTIASFVPNVPAPFLEGVPVTWTAVAAGGTAPLQYQFWLYHSSTNSWSMLRDYSTQNTVTYTPVADAAQAIQVWVRSANSSAPYEAWRSSGYFSVTLRPKVHVTSLTPAPWYPLYVGVPVTWKAAAVDGVPPIQYKFWVYQSGVWSVLRDYSTADSAAWTPPASGIYGVQVWVRSAGSTAQYDAYLATGLFYIGNVGDPAPPVITSLDCDYDYVAPLPVGTTVTWTATTTGGVEPVEYKFVLQSPDMTWSVLQDYSASNTVAWTPLAPGVYAVQVWVRNAGSTALFQAYLGAPSITVGQF